LRRIEGKKVEKEINGIEVEESPLIFGIQVGQ